MPKGDPNSQNVRAKKVLEINREHKVFNKIKTLFDTNKYDLKEFAEVLLCEAKLIEGLPVEDMGRFVELVTKFIAE